jgi:hypothetical protein
MPELCAAFTERQQEEEEQQHHLHRAALAPWSIDQEPNVYVAFSVLLTQID